jgi:hypothetical protein
VSFGLVMFAGQEIVGACVSSIRTVNEQLAELLDASLTVHETVVMPFGKKEPAAGMHAGAPTPEQLSLTVGDG